MIIIASIYRTTTGTFSCFAISCKYYYLLLIFCFTVSSMAVLRGAWSFLIIILVMQMVTLNVATSGQLLNEE